jgi:hypothetical protein
MTEFHTFPKIARLFRDIVITEKIDGTNVQVTILSKANYLGDLDYRSSKDYTAIVGDYFIFAGSRKRWIQPGNDNFGFAKWVSEHAEQLVTILGEGTHYGEWWGQGVQRKYGLDHKRFSLFNTARWGFLREDHRRAEHDVPEALSSVPILYSGIFSQSVIEDCLTLLKHTGSMAAPGFKNPEGIVVFHTHSNTLHKVTLEGDQAKGPQ